MAWQFAKEVADVLHLLMGGEAVQTQWLLLTPENTDLL
jgi:hypothetical protein